MTLPEQAEIKAAYERDGFIVVPDVFSPEECRDLKREGLRVLHEHASQKASVHVGVAAASALFYQLADDPRIIEYLSPLMPDGVMFLSDKFVFKSGAQRFGTPWHCDQAYWAGTRPKLSVWIALDGVTAQNGALKVLPGAHRKGWTHRASDGADSNGEFGNTIAELSFDAPGERVCEMTMGSMLIFSDLLPHASTPNSDGADRYALISTYHAPAPDDEFDVHFHARHVIVAA